MGEGNLTHTGDKPGAAGAPRHVQEAPEAHRNSKIGRSNMKIVYEIFSVFFRGFSNFWKHPKLVISSIINDVSAAPRPLWLVLSSPRHPEALPRPPDRRL